MKQFSLFGQKFETTPFLIVLLSTIFLIILGSWQLERRKEKLDFVSKIDANIANPPLKITTTTNSLEFYTKVELKGQFLNGQNVFLYGRRTAYPERDGYYLVTPFKTDFGDVYWVSRAWVPQSALKRARSFKVDGEETIIAFALPGEEKKFFMPDTDVNNKVWFILDLGAAMKKFGTTTKEFYLMQVGSQNLPKGSFALTSNYLNVIKNDHLEYALTWYTLATFMCIIYFLYNRHRNSLEAEKPESEAEKPESENEH